MQRTPNQDLAGRRRWIPALWVASLLFLCVCVAAPPLAGPLEPMIDGTIAAQTSPLSPLAGVSGSTVSTRALRLPSDPLASGHAGLWRAAIVLAVVATVAVIMIWRHA